MGKPDTAVPGARQGITASPIGTALSEDAVSLVSQSNFVEECLKLVFMGAFGMVQRLYPNVFPYSCS